MYLKSAYICMIFFFRALKNRASRVPYATC